MVPLDFWNTREHSFKQGGYAWLYTKVHITKAKQMNECWAAALPQSLRSKSSFISFILT